ncbi:MAG: GldG family protein [Deltaproteobacteria bacterium]|nr:GldG family protein [Deltaproteobacteria bacterium]MBW1871291.1 GldG family protein [Deltaproteobacteria bacterium]
MTKFGRILGIVGFVSLLSVPLTLFLWDWKITWVAIGKLVFGILAIGFWLSTNYGKIRQTFQGRSVFYTGFATLYAIMAVAAVVVVNYICYKYPYQIDFTEEKIHTLSDQTLQILNGLESDVEVVAFYGPKEREYGAVRNYLERYRQASARFVYEFADPVARQDLVERYKIHQGGPRIIVSYEGRQERIKLGGSEQSGPEEAITTALLKATAKGDRERICFVTGHGEKALSGDDSRQVISLFVRDMLGEGFDNDTISLLEQARVPAICQAVVLVGPKEDLAEGELLLLKEFLQKGGRLLAFLGAMDSSSLNNLLKDYGIQIGNNTVIYPKGQRPLYVVSDPRRYPRKHPIFSRFFKSGMIVLQQLQAVLPLARSVSATADMPRELQATELVLSTTRAWGETDTIADGVQVVFTKETDTPGPVPLAVVVEHKLKSAASKNTGLGRIAVFGSSLMVTDSAYRVFPFNRNLIMNTLAWLTYAEKKIAIRPRFREASLLRLSQSQMKFITFFSTDILPLLILGLGITIWQIRRWS